MLRNLFKRRDDRSAQVTEDDLLERFRTAEMAVLEAGGGTLYDWTNIAPGTPGYALCSLEYRGLMKVARTYERSGPTSYGWVCRYSLTDAGKAARAMMRD